MSISPLAALPEALARLEAASGPNEKIALIRHYDSPELRQVIRRALDPFQVFHLARVDDLRLTIQFSRSVEDAWQRFNAALDKLMFREATGNDARALASAAIDNLAIYGLADVGRRVLLKDLRCGVQASVANKAIPGLVPTFDVMLAKPVDMDKVRYPVLVQTKYDGKRCIVAMPPGRPTVFYSRNGKIIEGYAHIRELLERWRAGRKFEGILDGELMFGMFGDRKAKEHEAELWVFDWLPWDEWTVGKGSMAQEERQERLLEMIPWDGMGDFVSAASIEKVHDLAGVERLYRDVLADGGEGVMLKDPAACYQFKRSAAWQKLKPELDADLRVVSYFEGEGKYQRMLGGVVVDFRGVEVRVGSGFADWERKHWWTRRDELIGKVTEVAYTETTPEGSLRFPRFRRFRDDKTAD